MSQDDRPPAAERVGRPRPAIEPRLLSHRLAAEYCGMSVPHFDNHIGSQVPPMAFGRKKLWDRRAIDEWLDRRGGLGEAPTTSIDWARRVLDSQAERGVGLMFRKTLILAALLSGIAIAPATAAEWGVCPIYPTAESNACIAKRDVTIKLCQDFDGAERMRCYDTVERTGRAPSPTPTVIRGNR
jgi:predicted DNA-binding transcriptional regulator AlpA